AATGRGGGWAVASFTAWRRRVLPEGVRGGSTAMTEGTPTPRPRLFLSYGRGDAGDLADRLRVDLEASGFEVWQDTRRIRSGRRWEREIEAGLGASEVVLALLSRHAVRRATDPDSPDGLDSVCLDEISFARFALRKPIVPVLVTPCRPPFCI